MDRRSPEHRTPHPITQQAYEEAMQRLHGTRSLLDTVPLERFVAVDETVGDPVDGMRLLAGARPENWIAEEVAHAEKEVAAWPDWMTGSDRQDTDPSEDPTC